MAPARDFAGAAEKLAQARRECGVAGIDGILGIADEMGETDLMVLLGPIHLGGEPVETQKSGRCSPRNCSTTALLRLGWMTKQASSAWWNTHGHQVRLPTRTLVSSDCRMVPASRRARIRFAARAKACLLSSSMLTSAPSLISSPSRSENSRESRSNEIAWVKRK